MNKERIICVLMLMFALILLTSSCSKDEESNNNTPTNNEESNNNAPTSNDNYYVKYEVLNGKKKEVTSGIKTERTVTLKDVNREITIQIASVPWEGTYGPFKKGDKVYMTLISQGDYNSIGRLSVSKNKEAFAIKDEFWYSNSGSLAYTIDY